MTAMFVVALAAPSQGAPSAWVQLMPFALVLAIFYFIILMPMKRRQQKVADFLAGLKEGDKVVTSGGIYGTITKISEQALQLQIAERVRVDVSRSAIVAVLVIFAGVGVYPILASNYRLPSPAWLQQKQLKLGLDLKGGVHLVLRV